MNYEMKSMSNSNYSDIQNLERTFKISELSDRKYRKRTTNFVFLYNNDPVTLCCKKQYIVVLPTSEAEYVSAAQCCQEMKVFKSVVEILMNKNIKNTLCVDNQRAIAIIKRGQMSRRNNHTDMKYHFNSDLLNNDLSNIQNYKTC
ncbi:uncharacterized protein LOC126118183 [Schistocerca cancellata]|uniref:uncharacterized protein LOC126118183 n=1 Tax=Schistocerca cancellata TaxID=274614 RepID=UPI0021198430|nr:uncharacterized protein LOC126118183 [Schistocerca cancellata]